MTGFGAGEIKSVEGVFLHFLSVGWLDVRSVSHERNE
jgi:hypothetical protein